MVYFTLALALFQHDSCDDVAEHMVCGVPELGQSIPNRSSFTRARQRLGAQAIERVFRKLTGPLAPAGLEGSFYRGMRLAAVDGFVLDAPETEANRRRLGGPKDARGQVAGFPQVRVVTLTTGTHAQIGAAVDGACCGEPELAIRLAPSAAGMLVIMDRGFPGVALWRAYTGAGAHLLIRARSCVAAHPGEYLPDGTYLAR
jgi:Insertion element 4 transposase N-terminal